MSKLSGKQRFDFTREWIKRGRPPTKEGFIKRCCEAYGIEYVAPIDLEKERNIISKERAKVSQQSFIK